MSVGFGSVMCVFLIWVCIVLCRFGCSVLSYGLSFVGGLVRLVIVCDSVVVVCW